MGRNMNQNIFLITVFEKCEPSEKWYTDLGCTRSVGFRYTFEEAEEVVRNNMCDIWETCYHYACIEEISPMLYPHCENSYYYKYNKDIDGYEKIEAPELLKERHFPIGGIG